MATSRRITRAIWSGDMAQERCSTLDILGPQKASETQVLCNTRNFSDPQSPPAANPQEPPALAKQPRFAKQAGRLLGIACTWKNGRINQTNILKILIAIPALYETLEKHRYLRYITVNSIVWDQGFQPWRENYKHTRFSFIQPFSPSKRNWAMLARPNWLQKQRWHKLRDCPIAAKYVSMIGLTTWPNAKI